MPGIGQSPGFFCRGFFCAEKMETLFAVICLNLPKNNETPQAIYSLRDLHNYLILLVPEVGLELSWPQGPGDFETFSAIFVFLVITAT